jgi:hypothetical protein
MTPDGGAKLASLLAGPRLGALDFLASGAGFGDQTALSVFADARLFAPDASQSAPLFFAFGKKEQRVALAFDVSAVALPAVARLFALDRSP